MTYTLYERLSKYCLYINLFIILNIFVSYNNELSRH